LTRVAFVSESDGWAVGNQGVVLHYDGKTWAKASVPAKRNLYGVAFTSPNDGWIVGAKGFILHYDGKSWEKFASPAEKTLLDVAFAGPEQGYAVGRGGEILLYRNKRWESSASSPTRKPLFTVAPASSGALWVAGTTRDVYVNKTQSELR
jgi:photosystem II stability/assembly factor-like uncharacterized protein